MLNKYQPLFLKYRPQAISELVGQQQVATTLANAIKYDRISHAYLFTGPRGYWQDVYCQDFCQIFEL